METVGSIQVVASINTKDYDAGKKHIESGNSELENSAKKTSSGFSAAWTGAIGGAVASITTKLIGAVSNLTGEMTDMYDASIKFPKVIQNMGGSSDFASKSFNMLKKYADDTIYSLEDMTKTFGTLYAVSGNKAGPLVKALGGVSALASNATQAMDSWSLQLTQMVSKPTVAWQDFRILLEQNPAAISKIAESMGKTSSQIVQDVQNGTLSTESFLTALQNVGNDPSLQKMATDSDNFRNATGQLQAAVVSAGQKILEKFGPTMVGVINGAADSVKSLSDNFIGVIDWLNKGGPAVDIVKSLAVAVGTATTALLTYNATMKIITVTTAAYTAISSYLTLVASLQAQGLGLLRAAWLGLNIVMSANPIGLVIAAVAALVAGLVYFFTQTETGRQIWAGFTQFLGAAITNIGNWFKGLWDGIVGVFSGVAGWFGSVFSGAWNAIVSIWSVVAGWFAGVWNGIVAIFTPVVQFYTNIFTTAWNAIVNIWNVAAGWFAGVWNGIVGVFNGVANWFGGVFRSAWNAITSVFSAVGGFFSGVWNTIVSIFGNVGTSIGDAIGSAFKNVINTVLRGAINIINGFINAINGAIGIINKIPGVNIGKLGKLGVPNFAEGGFTGRGGKYEAAGIVHKGEYVVPKQYVNQSTGLPEIGGNKEYNITNNYVVNNQADAEIISRKQAYAMGAV